MHLTRFTDYGLRTLIFLALKPDSLGSIAEIAAAYGVSESHMTKVVHTLGRAGLIATLRGRRGGIRLARPAAAIGLGDVVRATEPEMALVECQGGGHCAIDGACRLHGIMDEAATALFAVLDRYTVADVAAPGRRVLLRRLGLAQPGARGQRGTAAL
jgi:Rrf2 family nitric oxide-sensitive transcriptional repressor